MSVPPSKKHKGAHPNPLAPMTSAQLLECKSLLDNVLIEKDANHPKRLLATDFKVLPDRQEWADYYKVITEPRCLNEIQTQLLGNKYTSAQTFLKDLHLVFQNAQYYNEETSLIAQDAKRLDQLVSSIAGSKALLGGQASPAPSSSQSPGPSSSTPRPSSSFAGPALAPPPAPGTLTPQGVFPKKRGRPSNADIAARVAAQLAGGNYSPEEAAAIAAAAKAPKVKPTVKPAPGSASSSTPSRAPAKASSSKPTPIPSPSQLSAPPLPPLPPQPISQQHTRDSSPAYQMPMPMDLLPMDFGSPAGGYYPSGFSDAGGVGGVGLEEGNIEDDQDDKLAGSRETVAAMDAGLSKLEGFEEVGWMEEDEGGGVGRRERCEMILKGVKGYKDGTGYRLADVLDRLPEATDNAYLTFEWPLSLASIEHQVLNAGYVTIVEFDKDMARLFEKARRFFVEGSQEYGHVLVLQRLYQTLSSPDPVSTGAATNFAFLTAGPGVARPLKTGEIPTGDPLVVTALRINTKDRDFLASAYYKGMTFSPGEYVHLANPNDPAKPIIGHIFKVFVPKGGDRVSISVCWYFRPEQTIHPADRTFYESEVFKTAQFADHVLEDIIEKICCQFYTKAIRGRPRPPGWYPGWPLYVCDSRWNDKDKTMIRIKNWNSCIPDELRKTDFMSVYPFPSVIKLRRVLSPFLRGVTGPGSIGEAGFTGGGGEAADDDGDDGATPSAVDSAAKKANKKVDAEKELRRLAAMSGQRLLGTPGPAAPGSPFHSGTPAQSSGPRTVGQTPHPLANPRTQALTAAQLLRGSSTPSHGQHGYQGHPSGASTPMGQHNRGSSNQQQQQPYHSAPGHHQQGANGRAPYGGQAQQGPMAGRRAISDRSVVGNSGGAQWVTHVAAIDAVSESTAARFERDLSTNKLLWFSAPPLYSLPPALPKPKHSLAYLTHLANRKAAGLDTSPQEDFLDPELVAAFSSDILGADAGQAALRSLAKELDGLDVEGELRRLEQGVDGGEGDVEMA